MSKITNDHSNNPDVSILQEICDVPADDIIEFEVVAVERIMDEMDYSGIRVHMKAKCERMYTPIKIDVSTGDVITSREIDYHYDLMLED